MLVLRELTGKCWQNGRRRLNRVVSEIQTTNKLINATAIYIARQVGLKMGGCEGRGSKEPRRKRRIKSYNKAQDATLDIHARGFWERHRSAFFDVRVCHPNTVSYRDLEPQRIYPIHENEKKRLYSKRVLDIEHGTFTPLVFTTTDGMGKEYLMYHSRLAQLIAIKKGEQYAKTISWIRTRTSFALLRSALVCLRGSRTRRVPCDIKNVDIDLEVVEGAIQSD